MNKAVSVTVVLGTNSHSFLAPFGYFEETCKSLRRIFTPTQIHMDFDWESGSVIVNLIEPENGAAVICYTFQALPS